MQDIAEDVTREALDRLGTSVIQVRLIGKMDYKRARYVLHEDYSLRQALFVDSKAENATAAGTATIQTAQTSMVIHQVRSGELISQLGGLPTFVRADGQNLLTTTIFVKYSYRELDDDHKQLDHIIVIALPNGLLQDRYNPDARTTFWMAGRNAPTLGEQFRVRIGIARLKSMANWRVQHVQITPTVAYAWDD